MEESMKLRIISIVVLCLVAFAAFGRFIRPQSLKDLTKDATLVFVGRVKSVKPSGITTHLSYPTWENVTFAWLSVDVEVLEPFKGVRRGDVVQAMMLSLAKESDEVGIINAPGIVSVQKGDLLLLFLGPTPVTNAFAGLSAPYDDYLSIFLLDRGERQNSYYQKASGREGDPVGSDEKHNLIWSLVDDEKQLIPSGAEDFRKRYSAEISAPPSTNIIYLEWQKYTNPRGWFSDIPKGFVITNSPDNEQRQTNSTK
jgi:hypothetical protein